MSAETIANFEQFWPYYVKEHRLKTTRTMHFVGTSGVIGLVATAVLTRKVWPLLVAPFAGYGPAWVSHYFVENNRPASFKYPLWSLVADFKMWGLIARGEMDAELERILRADDSMHAANGSAGETVNTTAEAPPASGLVSQTSNMAN